MEDNVTKGKSQSSQSSEGPRLVIKDGHPACDLFQIFENSPSPVWSTLWRRDQQQASTVHLTSVGKARSEEAPH
jgi:hypothetical protein